MRLRPSRRLVAALLIGSVLVVGGACARHPPRDTVRLLLTGPIRSLDPNQDYESTTDSVLFNVYETLVSYDANLELRTTLAESWEHPSPERWRFHLRRGVRFHDGSPLTAQSVADSVALLRRSPDLEGSHFVHQIQDVVVVSPDVVDIVTREPRAILASLASLYITRPNASGSEPRLVGTGPYRIASWVPHEKVVLDRFDGYWGPAPAFPHAVFEVVGDAGERVARLRDDRADVAYSIPGDHVGHDMADVRFVRHPGLTVYYLGFDVAPRPDNPFADARVRHAFDLAIDREQLVTDGLHGLGSPIGQPVAPLVFGFDPTLRPTTRNVAEARRLLAEAGRSGLRVRLDLPRSRSAIGQMLTAQLGEAGITLDLSLLGSGDVFDRAESGKSSLFFIGWDCSSGEASEFYEINLHTRDATMGGSNYQHYSDRELDDIAERNAAVLDQRERQALLQRAARIVQRDLPVLPLFEQDEVYGVRRTLQFRPRADSEVRLADLGIRP